MRAGGRGIPGMTHSLEPGEVGKVWLSGSPGSVWGGHSCCLFRGVSPLRSLRLSIFIMLMVFYTNTNSSCGSPYMSHFPFALVVHPLSRLPEKLILLVTESAHTPHHLLQDAFLPLWWSHSFPPCSWDAPARTLIRNRQGNRRFWESQFLGRLIRSPGSLRRRKGSRALKREKGVRVSQGREKDKHFFLHCFVLVNITMYLAQGFVSP